MLRRVYKTLYASAPQMRRELSLSISVKAMNDTMGPNRSVPSLLLFGELPKMPQISRPNLSPNSLLIAQSVARAKFETAISKKRIHSAVSGKSLAAKEEIVLFLDYDSRYTWRKRKYGQGLISNALLRTKRFLLALRNELEQRNLTLHA